MNTQPTFMLKKIEKISIINLQTWRCNQPLLSRTNFDGPIGVRAIEVRLYANVMCFYLDELVSVTELFLTCIPL